MSGANDIANLFARFGGKPEHYQEIGRADQARDSEARWPLLSSVGAQSAHPPAVQHGQPRAAAPSPFAMPEPAPRGDGRTEPTLPWGAQPPTLTDAVFSAPVIPEPAAPEPAAAPAAAPLSQFIAPRPRGHVRPAPVGRAAAVPLSAQAAAPVDAPSVPGFGGAAAGAPAFAPAAPAFAAPAPAQAAAPAPTPFAPSAPPAPTPAAAPAAAPAGGPGAGSPSLGSVFERLARPAPAAPPPSAPLSLFERLVRR